MAACFETLSVIQYPKKVQKDRGIQPHEPKYRTPNRPEKAGFP